MTGPTILVADDEDTVRHVVGRMLRASGFAVLEAGDGREALQVVQQREHPPDLILTDVVMPLLNGGELASRVRASRPDQRILLMSTYAVRSPSSTSRYRRAGSAEGNPGAASGDRSSEPDTPDR